MAFAMGSIPGNGSKRFHTNLWFRGNRPRTCGHKWGTHTSYHRTPMWRNNQPSLILHRCTSFPLNHQQRLWDTKASAAAAKITAIMPDDSLRHPTSPPRSASSDSANHKLSRPPLFAVSLRHRHVRALAQHCPLPCWSARSACSGRKILGHSQALWWQAPLKQWAGGAYRSRLAGALLWQHLQVFTRQPPTSQHH